MTDLDCCYIRYILLRDADEALARIRLEIENYGDLRFKSHNPESLITDHDVDHHYKSLSSEAKNIVDLFNKRQTVPGLILV